MSDIEGLYHYPLSLLTNLSVYHHDGAPLLRDTARAETRGGRAMHLLVVALTTFTESDRFERWSHFKDAGLPGTVNDTLNQAAIADGACRMLPDASYSGYTYWHYPQRVRRVLDALGDAPSTLGPSAFTLSAGSGLAEACEPAVEDEPANVSTVTARAAAMDTWVKALCAPSSSPVWRGAYDPAYMPQQQALTVGFVCIVACEANGAEPSADGMADLSSYSAAARDGVCEALPWDDAIPARFGGATQRAELARLTEPLLDTPCVCPREVAPGSPDAPLWPTYAAGAAALGFAAFVLVALCRKRRRTAAARRLYLFAADAALEDPPYRAAIDPR